jgi:hypothetical protein
MAQREKREQVHLAATEPVEIEPGVIIPAGTYAGIRVDTGLETHQGVSWAPPRYVLALTGEQVRSFGARVSANTSSVEYDVSKHVRLGKLTV